MGISCYSICDTIHESLPIKYWTGTYYRILKSNPLNSKIENHIKILIEVVNQFQDYSFVRSHKTDLYQQLLNEIIVSWNTSFDTLSIDDDPKTILTAYIHEKIMHAKHDPDGSKILTGHFQM